MCKFNLGTWSLQRFLVYLHTTYSEILFWVQNSSVLFCFLKVDGVWGSCWLLQFCVDASPYQNRCITRLSLLGEGMQDHFLRLPIYPTVNSLDYSENNLLLSRCCFLLFFAVVLCAMLFLFPVFSSLVLFYFSFPFFWNAF